MKPIGRKLKRNAMLAVAVSAIVAGAVVASATAGDGGLGPARTARVHSGRRAHGRAHARSRHLHRGTHGGVLALSAHYLGLPRAQLRRQLRSGRTLAQIAAATSGKSAAGLIDALLSAKTAQLSAAAGTGALSQAKARARIAKLGTRVTLEVERVRPVAELKGTRRAGASTALAATGVTIYQPFTPHGSIKSRTRSRAGDCPSGSEATPRGDAWRCFSGNLVLDPCFSSTRDRGIVVCPEAPWLKGGVEIRLTKPLRRANGNHSAPSPSLEPWALELYDGLRCLFAGGATNVVEGQRFNYFCGAGSHEGLWGYPDRSSTPWGILIGTPQATSLSQRATVRHAWT